MNNRTCTMPGCDKPHRAKGLCNTHYGQQNANKYRKVVVQCTWCKADCEKEAGRSSKYGNLFCSLQCRSLHRKSLVPPKPEKVKVDRRSPLRRAYESGDGPAVLSVIREKAATNENGCWLWPKMDRSGYPTTRIANRSLAVHRLALEASLGEPLGCKQAHHRCAEPSCVNPGHLQAVEHVDNRAEMFKRRWYEARIEELEAALARVDPTNPALRRGA